MSLVDADHRGLATNPSRSFIVQAPAGSGKTEILTQRYLCLLSRVSAPEQIIALTFTRKAASEMRERIILALQLAASNHKAETAHQETTLSFARQALAQSERLQWNLLQQSKRLKICTIDALCQNINQSIPLLSQQLSYSKITDTPSLHYLNAARNCMQFALQSPVYQDAIRTLLLHMDNRQDRLLELWVDLLAKRDQWTPLLFLARAQARASFEKRLSLMQEEALCQFKQSLPAPIAGTLVQLARELAMIENQPESPRFILQDWFKFDEADRDIIKALCKLLLTNEDKLRTGFDHHVGLRKESCPLAVYKTLKENSKTLLAQLSDYPDFLQSLLRLSILPEVTYEDQQWAALDALFLLLPLLLGHLHLYFCEHNELDFTSIAQQAITALGDALDPTDLALYLDNAIHHLLIDEFQDTSHSQFEFISKLVQGWQPNEGKTLFIVGDPMQSIYRFRQAEVGLFFQAKEKGIQGISLDFLQLQSNFRSTKTLVNWVNHQFDDIFPKTSELLSGAVSFHPSVSLSNIESESFISALQYADKTQEAQSLVDLIRLELERDQTQNLAILVRSRTQLTEIIRCLRQTNIPYQGSDIDLLAKLPHLRDVFSLTQALLSPANRLSWLSCLRSPFCGLSLADLLCIATFNKKASIHQALLHLEEIQGLSHEGRLRAQYFSQAMQKALNHRLQHRLSAWLASTLKDLQVDQIFNQKQMDDLDQFWTLIDRYEEAGRLPHWREFIKEFNALYSAEVTPSRLHVMTIHKSKGLEFDTVFLPGLSAATKPKDKPLIRWSQLEDGFILAAPIPVIQDSHAPLYDYLASLDEEKTLFEAQRLLYVAVTRAKTRLYLSDNSAKGSKSSFLSMLKHQTFSPVDSAHPLKETPHPQPKLVKLPIEYYPVEGFNKVTIENNKNKLHLSDSLSRLRGIVSHRLMHWICENHPQDISQVPWKLACYAFEQLGFDEKTRAKSLAVLKNQIKRLFQDPRGLWIIKAHEEEKNEYELLVDDQGIGSRILDRIFKEEDKLWIIDFKFGKNDLRALEQHKAQLAEYKYFLSSKTALTIHCGLYYLELNEWIDC